MTADIQREVCRNANSSSPCFPWKELMAQSGSRSFQSRYVAKEQSIRLSATSRSLGSCSSVN